MTNETHIPRTDPATLTDEYLLAEYERDIRASLPPEIPYTGPQPPMTQAAAALQRARQVVATSDMLEDMACELETCIRADGLASPHESSAMLVAQARVLDFSVQPLRGPVFRRRSHAARPAGAAQSGPAEHRLPGATPLRRNRQQNETPRSAGARPAIAAGGAEFKKRPRNWQTD